MTAAPLRDNTWWYAPLDPAKVTAKTENGREVTPSALEIEGRTLDPSVWFPTSD
jgi:hypothetical protein